MVCVAESDHTYHQKNIGGSTQATCIVYPLSLLTLAVTITVKVVRKCKMVEYSAPSVNVESLCFS